MQADAGSGGMVAVGVLALLWNLLGLVMLALQLSMSPAALAALPPEQREVYAATPGWVELAFAVAVLGGLAGSLGLLLRRRWALAGFAVSLAGLVVQIGGAYAMTPAWTAYGPAGLIMPAVLLVVAALLLGYARRVRARLR
ncbi:hypothetical protein [Coralloluteibacterium stylophorae]|uniref:Sugar transporter n=1 Tax=Coralloluteibacterium stylophorae TaxID=1776034 RepID=A0A8J8AWS2_9GAMM|nr:hypothetical protein [Coralloluteibacterium stylophorae]MBS7456976.1 hypothetical protein [Coralloluteibacterium stylophorae]